MHGWHAAGSVLFGSNAVRHWPFLSQIPCTGGQVVLLPVTHGMLQKSPHTLFVHGVVGLDVPHARSVASRVGARSRVNMRVYVRALGPAFKNRTMVM